MPNRRLKTSLQRYGIITTVLFLAMVFGIGQSLAYWSEPDETAPDSSTAHPIIVGIPGVTQAIQSKLGPLIVQGTLNIQSPVTTTTLNVNSDITVLSQLCLNDDCTSSWGTLIGDYVHLSPAIPDIGTIEITSVAADPANNSKVIPLTSQFGVQATADVPTGDRTAAIVGESYNFYTEDAEATIGIAGLASAQGYCQGGGDDGDPCSITTFPNSCTDNGGVCVGNSSTRGVWGSDGGFANAWAGRYQGRFGVEGDLCLNGDCRNIGNWGPPEDDTLVKVQSPGIIIPQFGEVNIEGSAKTGQFVIGEPLPSTSVLITCGDHICNDENFGNNGESIITCPADCI